MIVARLPLEGWQAEKQIDQLGESIIGCVVGDHQELLQISLFYEDPTIKPHTPPTGSGN